MQMIMKNKLAGNNSLKCLFNNIKYKYNFLNNQYKIVFFNNEINTYNFKVNISIIKLNNYYSIILKNAEKFINKFDTEFNIIQYTSTDYCISFLTEMEVYKLLNLMIKLEDTKKKLIKLRGE